MTVLVIAEHDNTTLNPATFSIVAGAAKLGGELHILVAGKNCAAAAQAASKITGVAKIIHAHDHAYANGLAENLANLIAHVGQNCSHVVAPASFFGKNVLPRAAALMNVGQVSDVIAIESADIFVRPIYAGNALATVQASGSPIVLTLRPTAFDPVQADGGNASIETRDSTGDTGLSSFIGRELTKSERPDLQTAKIVISGGRGLGSGDNYEKLIIPLADKLGAAVGASRAAVDAGYVPNDYQVGQTGKIVAPQLYIAVGISGAIQHLAGMKDSKVIVAINKDEEAPIFQIADYGLVADYKAAVPELMEELKKAGL